MNDGKRRKVNISTIELSRINTINDFLLFSLKCIRKKIKNIQIETFRNSLFVENTRKYYYSYSLHAKAPTLIFYKFLNKLRFILSNSRFRID